MSEAAEQDRSQAPSRFRLDKARREGSVARGTDLGFLSVLLVSTAFAWFAGRDLADALGRGVARSLAATSLDLTADAGFRALAGQVAGPAFETLLPWLCGLFGLVLLVEFLQTGPVFALTAVRPDFNRLNPAKGLKRLFTIRILIETAKAVLKLSLYAAIAALFIRDALNAAAVATDARALGLAYGGLALRLIAACLGAAVVVALLDQMVARRDYLKKMRMSRRELKREHRDHEGDPRLKQRRKQLHGQFAEASRSLKGLGSADVVIANPVHFAVGLRYAPGRMDAPVVVARGSHALAVRLRRMAFGRGIPVVVDPPLARALYRKARLDAAVPEALFRPVAAVYRGLRRSGAMEAANG
ncbi:flagellar biosynthesis protein FlhB [Brevundimonas intermedia]|uniref:Flagellar biosynthesis protein FlhB n=1 Tax=Brevundimonas intermedia TaxID=74315 RepID=A0ABQ5TDK8_9CAUL|nr:EscU/YscU/HrcU family type III secretion system export apparatus switch protein [Brevundimonas intermedia]GLK50172.1 flagellar biosynthesis protein FlhB [Brevundimonas intermedia]